MKEKIYMIVTKSEEFGKFHYLVSAKSKKELKEKAKQDNIKLLSITRIYGLKESKK